MPFMQSMSSRGEQKLKSLGTSTLAPSQHLVQTDNALLVETDPGEGLVSVQYTCNNDNVTPPTQLSLTTGVSSVEWCRYSPFGVATPSRGASAISMSRVIASTSYCGVQPQSLRARESSMLLGQLSAMAWRKSGA